MGGSVVAATGVKGLEAVAVVSGHVGAEVAAAAYVGGGSSWACDNRRYAEVPT